jgi:AcrR family transcriptional regulator
VVVEARKFPRQERSRALVETILEATARILVEDGYARTSTNRVAERAGVSIGSLYQYFPSREALVAGVARRHSERLKTELERALPSTSGLGLKEAISTLMAAVMSAHRINPELNAVLAGEVPNLGTLDWKADTTERGIAVAQSLLEAHIGEVRPGLDVNAAAFLISTAVEATVNAAWRQRPHSISDGSLERDLTSLVYKYVT